MNDHSRVALTIDDSVDRDLADALQRYLDWYEPRRRVPDHTEVRIVDADYVLDSNRQEVQVLIRWSAPPAEVTITIAVGDYLALKKEEGRDDPIAGILFTLTTELLRAEGVRRKDVAPKIAEVRRLAHSIFDDYKESVPHP